MPSFVSRQALLTTPYAGNITSGPGDPANSGVVPADGTAITPADQSRPFCFNR
jgi:hypothetical protein